MLSSDDHPPCIYYRVTPLQGNTPTDEEKCTLTATGIEDVAQPDVQLVVPVTLYFAVQQVHLILPQQSYVVYSQNIWQEIKFRSFTVGVETGKLKYADIIFTHNMLLASLSALTMWAVRIASWAPARCQLHLL